MLRVAAMDDAFARYPRTAFAQRPASRMSRATRRRLTITAALRKSW
jgi:hypothetical protein